MCSFRNNTGHDSNANAQQEKVVVDGSDPRHNGNDYEIQAMPDVPELVFTKGVRIGSAATDDGTKSDE